MRAQNERLVLSLIRRLGPLAKAEIARLTGLSAQTVSVIMRALETKNLLIKCDPIRGKVGQPSVPMRLAENGAYFFGLKIGRRNTELLLSNFVGTVVSRVNDERPFQTPDSTLRFVREATARLRRQLPSEHQCRISGLGIAMPFHIWDWEDGPDGASEQSVAWRGRDIRREIASIVDFPVFFGNDTSAACGAELVFGKNVHARDFLYFNVGYFIGGGLVLNGSVFSGRTGNAGALGSIPIPSGDGTRQLIEVASLSVLEKQLADAGLPSDGIWRQSDAWSVDPPILQSWIEAASQGIASAVAAACSVIDFEAVVIDGQIPPEVRRDLVARCAHHLERQNLAGIDPPEIQEGTIGPDARILGAASLPLADRFLEEKNLFSSGQDKVGQG